MSPSDWISLGAICSSILVAVLGGSYLMSNRISSQLGGLVKAVAGLEKWLQELDRNQKKDRDEIVATRTTVDDLRRANESWRADTTGRLRVHSERHERISSDLATVSGRVGILESREARR